MFKNINSAARSGYKSLRVSGKTGLPEATQVDNSTYALNPEIRTQK
jgi:hypothetical protein